MIKFSKTERIASKICGVLLFILASFLVTAIILNIIDYKPEGSLETLWTIGETLINSYGFSCILIPGFLMVAGAFCFDSQWTVQRAMGLLISIIPFFTIVGAEKIARKTVAFDTYTIMLVKLILLGVLTTLLVLTEYLVAMIIASAIQKKAFEKKNQAKDGENLDQDDESQTEQSAKKTGFIAGIMQHFSKPKKRIEVDEIDLEVYDSLDSDTDMDATANSEIDIPEDEYPEEDFEDESEPEQQEEQEQNGDPDKTIVSVQQEDEAQVPAEEAPKEKTQKTQSTRTSGDDTEFNEPKIAENFFDPQQEEKTVEVPRTTEELLKDAEEEDVFQENEKHKAGGTLSSLWNSTKNKFRDLMEFGKRREAEQEEERQRRKEEARRAKEEVDIDDYFEEAAPVLPKIDEENEKRENVFVNEHQKENGDSFIREETFDIEDELDPTDKPSYEAVDDDEDDIIRQFETGNLKLNENDFEPSFTDIQDEEPEVEIDISAFDRPKAKKDFTSDEDSIVFDEDASIYRAPEPERKPIHYSEEVERRHAREEAEAIEKKRKEMQAQVSMQKNRKERNLVDIESPLEQTRRTADEESRPKIDDFQFMDDEQEEIEEPPKVQVQKPREGGGLLHAAQHTLDEGNEEEEESESEGIQDIQFQDDEEYPEYEEDNGDDYLDPLNDDDEAEEEPEIKFEEKPKRRVPTGPYEIPTSLLTAYEDNPYWVIDDETKAAAVNLKETLAEFKIEAEITGIQKGPVVTMFEILPAPGVKLNRIVALQDNIALRLAASSVRIVAPIPGKHAVGIEVPNKQRAIISIRECLEQNRPEWTKMGVPVVLGKDIQGNTQIIDLVKTPHLLIAGATGAGKSVCVNSMIVSILYKRSPRDVKMILIDPKIVELKLYNDIPHLLTPVITEPKRAMQALQYCLCEMERRYALLDGMSVRDITSYNKKIVEKKIATEHLPYLIVVIDEFADLMATTGKQLEGVLARLAAMSRAVGIHLVLATQRPSIDVITGLIKANIPSRIAFMVASKTDSRIILDQMGADKLLGKGDMLYTSATDPFPIRIQGTFVSDGEVEDVVNAVKAWGEPEYIDDEIFVDDEEDGDEDQLSLFNPENGDPLFEKALDIVVQAGKASASYIQRRLKIGYNRAARLVEEMEERGIVGPANGSKPREIIHMP